uniref:Uncharacterized protein n=1 Tax=Schizaphis graminum TaxID=13262 RepID=A0A2S2PL46_SCHGA
MSERAKQYYVEVERMKYMYEISSELPDTSSRTVHLPGTVGGEGYDDGSNSIHRPLLTERSVSLCAPTDRTRTKTKKVPGNRSHHGRGTLSPLCNKRIVLYCVHLYKLVLSTHNNINMHYNNDNRYILGNKIIKTT